ncbi:metallophosphoesterase [Ramlibacter terrae]|uniref:Metallophosphoesterase n=1 Tax=Ramlibacter terrae TaxID=2732511 RepID=A0ABX6P691_9BURK|nr:metallophosphoesterase [Ramlibacter terrae]
MKLHILSDLHLGQAGFACPATEADAIVLAGDIGRPEQAIGFAQGLGKPVLFVPGNHEFYGGSLAGGRERLRALCEGTNVHLLDPGEVVLQGVRFLGATLWTDFRLFDDPAQRDESLQACLRFMRDFQRIRMTDDGEAPFTPADAAALFRVQAGWLQERLATPHAGPTVVITHHAPSARSIHARFAGSLGNSGFVSNADRLLGAQRACLWVHGHTHDSFDYDAEGTRVLCNPRGYARDGVMENARFDPALVVEVG